MIGGKQGIAVAAMLLIATAYFFQDPEWNGNSRLDLTRAIVERGTLSIDGYESLPGWGTEDKAFFQGHYYSDKAIGASLLAVPVYFLFYRMAAVLGIALSSVLTKHVLTTIILGSAFTVCGTVLYAIAARIAQNAWKALIASLGLSFGSMLWPYSDVFYGHVLAAAFLASSFYVLFRLDQGDEQITDHRMFWAGICAGFAIVTEYTAALIVVGLVAYGAHAMWRRGFARMLRAVLTSGLGTLVPLSLMFAYNYRIFGSPWATGYAFEAENRFSGGMSLGIMGLHTPTLSKIFHITIDPQFGVLWQSPILILAPVGLVAAVRTARYRAAGLLCMYAVSVMLAMNGGYYLWWGGSAFGPRLLIPALPFFIVPLALLPDALLGATGFLALLSSMQMLIPLMGQIQIYRLAYRANRHMFYIGDTPFTGFSLLYSYDLPLILKQQAAGAPAWTLGAALGVPYWLSVPVLIAIESALLLRFRRLVRIERDREGRSSAGEDHALQESVGGRSRSSPS